MIPEATSCGPCATKCRMPWSTRVMPSARTIEIRTERSLNGSFEQIQCRGQWASRKALCNVTSERLTLELCRAKRRDEPRARCFCTQANLAIIFQLKPQQRSEHYGYVYQSYSVYRPGHPQRQGYRQAW